MTDEELRDEILTLFEDKEEELLKQEGDFKSIEDEAMIDFDRRCIAIKNELVGDTTVSDEDLATRYAEEIEKLRLVILTETQEKINVYVEKVQSESKVDTTS